LFEGICRAVIVGVAQGLTHGRGMYDAAFYLDNWKGVDCTKVDL
jgi:hypothetical protein